MTEIEINAKTLLIQGTLHIDVPEEVLAATEKLKGGLPASEYERAMSVGESWQMSGGQDEIIVRGAVFDALRGRSSDENFPNHDFVDRGNSGGRNTNPLSVTDKGTGLSGQEKGLTKKSKWFSL